MARLAPTLTRLNGLIVAALTLGFVLFVWGAWRDYNVTWSRAIEQTQAIAVLLEQHAMGTLHAADQLSQRADALVTANPITESSSAPSLEDELRRLVGTLPFVAAIEVLNGQGEVVANSTPAFVWKTLAGAKEWLKAFSSETPYQVVGFARQEPSMRFIVSFLRRSESQTGDATGAVMVAIRSDYFEHAFRDAKVSPSAALSLFHKDGALVYRHPIELERLGRSFAQRPLFVDHLPRASSGTYLTASSIDGGDRIVSYRALNGYPLVATSSLAVADILSPWYYRTAWTGMLWLASAVAVICFALLTRRALVQEASTRRALETSNHRLTATVAEKEVLFREVHHRVKNNLQIVASLLTLESGRIKDVATQSRLRETLNRVESIAHVHRVLYQTNQAATVDLNRYLHELCDNLAATYGARERGVILNVTASPGKLDLERAISVALIVNEVVTNSFKHAFPPGKTGVVAVGISDGADEVVITVEDNGVGLPPETANMASIGMDLIRSLAEHAGATYSVHQNKGTKFILVVPKSTCRTGISA